MRRSPRDVRAAFHQTVPRPSPEFEQRLRQQLLTEFESQQRDNGRLNMSHAIPVFVQRSDRRPSLPLTLIAVILVILVSFVLVNGIIERAADSARLVQIDIPPVDLETLQPITSENAAELQQIGQLGNGRIDRLAWSPYGQTLALAGSLGIWLYDADNLDAGGQLWMTDSAALDVAYSPDGAFVASGHADGSVMLWDAATGTEVRSFVGNTSLVYSLAFSPDGTLLASGVGSTQDSTEDESLTRIWDVASGELVAALPVHTIAVRTVQFSPDSTQIMTLSWDGVVRIWSVQSSELLQTVQYPNAEAGYNYSNSFVDWERRRVGFIDQQSLTWVALDSTASEPQESIAITGDNSDYPGAIESIVAHQYSDVLAIGSYNAGVTIYNLNAEAPLEPLQLADLRMVSDAAFSPDGHTLAAVSAASTLHLFDTTAWEERAVLNDHLGVVNTMALTGNAETLYTSVDGGPIYIWDVLTGEEQPPILTGNVYALLLSPDNQTLVYSGGRLMSNGDSWNSIWVHNLETGEELGFPLSVPAGSLTQSPDGAILASPDFSQGLRLLDPATQQMIRTLPYSGFGNVVSAAFSPDGVHLLAGTSDGFALIYNIETGEPEESIYTPMPGQSIRWVGYSPDGRYFFTGAQIFRSDGDGEFRGSALQLWDAETQRQLHYFDLTTASGKDSQVLLGASMNTDGSLLAAGTNDNLWLWDTETGEQVNLIPDVSIGQILFSKDGKLMITGGGDGLIRLWGIPD